MLTEKQIKGKTKYKEYQNYSDAKNRCTNKNNKLYKYYGGRGIKFNFNSFEEFIEEIGFKPNENLSLDRIDNNGNYEKGNIKWSTHSEQMSNRRSYNHKFREAVEKAKKYIIIFPDGHKENILNMQKFCREHNLDKANLQSTTKFETRKHKGFRAIKEI